MTALQEWLFFLISSSFLDLKSPTQLGSKNGVTYDSSRTDEKQKLESSVQQQDSLQADSERGLVKLSSV